ncbi:MAG: right-handed parallel beta-helix repeat-containing protein [Conexivisphaerales archaeon]
MRDKSYMKLILLLLLVGLTFSSLAATHAQQGPPLIYVSTSGSNTSGDGSLAKPYATIQYAVSVAPPHAVIVVEPGTYHEMVNITKTVTLESASLQPSNTIIDAFGQVYGIEIIGLAASGTTINGLTIEHANNHGIFVQNAWNVTIENNYVIYNGLNSSKAIIENKGIQLSGTAYTTVINNYVSNNMADGGIGVSDEGQINPGGMAPGIPAPALGNVIADNVVTGNVGGCGIVVAAYNPGQGVLDNVVSNNMVFNGLPGGIVVAADVPNTVALNNTVAYNVAMNNLIPGIIVHSNTPGDVVANTKIVGNVVSGNAGFGPKTTGITVLANINGSTQAINTLISDNIIHNEYFGVLAANASSTEVLADNNFDSTVSVPVVGASASSTTLGSLSSQESQLTSEVNSLQAILSTLQNNSSQTMTQLASLQANVNSLQSNFATKQTVDSLSANMSSTADVAYAALALAVILGMAGIALALRK